MSSQECQDKVSSYVCDFQIPTSLAVLQPQILIFLLTFELGSRLTEVFNTTNLSCYWSQGILPCVSGSFSCCFWYKWLPVISPHCHFSGKLCRLLTLSLGIYNSLSKKCYKRKFCSFSKCWSEQKNLRHWTREIAWLAKCLPWKHEDLSLSLIHPRGKGQCGDVHL